MKKRLNLAALIIGVIVLTAALTFTITYTTVADVFSEQLMLERATSKRLAKIVNLVDTIDSSYVGEYEFDELLDGAAEGIVYAMDDIWSFYMDEEAYLEYKQQIANDYVGIGVSVVLDGESGGLRVIKVHSGSPAEKSGIKFKDLILAVDGKPVSELVSELGYEDAVASIRGEGGTDVVLGIGRGREYIECAVTRGPYVSNPISSEILEGNIGYIRIENFDSNADLNFATAINNLIGAEVEGIIFDVRANGGGFKDVMVDMLNILCPQGVLISMRDKNGNEHIDYSDAEEIDLPMAVIVDAESYSAAEFFAAALQEYGKAKVVGVKTFGKGYSQVTVELGDGSAVNISTNEYFTPSGKSLIGVGVTPDYMADRDQTMHLYLLPHDQDAQLQTAILAIKDEILRRAK